MQKAGTFPKKEQKKAIEPALSHKVAPRADQKKECGKETGMPFFLQRYAASFISTPHPVQRQPDEEDSEQFLQTNPISPLVQRDQFEDEEDITQTNSVSSSIQQKTDDEEPESEEFPVMPMLTIGSPNDKYEQEANQVADKVMRMPSANGSQTLEEEENQANLDGVVRTKPIAPSSVQRSCLKCDEELTKCPNSRPNIQTKSEGSVSAYSRVAKTLQSPGSGSPLHRHVRSKVEHVLGRDLNHVKVHSDTNANQAAQSINAKAFTHQNNIFLGKTQSANDISLMAHELTHVVQQGAFEVNPAVKINVQRQKKRGKATTKKYNNLENNMRFALIDWRNACSDGISKFSTYLISNRFDKLASGSWKNFLLGLIGDSVWASAAFWTGFGSFSISMLGVAISNIANLPRNVKSQETQIKSMLFEYFNGVEFILKQKIPNVARSLKNSASILTLIGLSLDENVLLSYWMKKTFKPSMYIVYPRYLKQPQINKTSVMNSTFNYAKKFYEGFLKQVVSIGKAYRKAPWYYQYRLYWIDGKYLALVRFGYSHYATFDFIRWIEKPYKKMALSKQSSIISLPRSKLRQILIPPKPLLLGKKGSSVRYNVATR